MMIETTGCANGSDNQNSKVYFGILPPLFRLDFTLTVKALHLFNQSFDITLAGLKRLEELGVFRNENLSDYEVMLELTRSEANDELTTVMQGYEEDDAAFWDDRYHERQKRLADPDAVFFAARDRKKEIKEQIKQLESGLARQHPKRRRAKKRS